MKKIILLFSLLCLTLSAQGQLYTATVESGDTLVSNTPDTTAKFLFYSGDVSSRKPERPVLFYIPTEIGTNTSHYWLELETQVTDVNYTAWATVDKRIIPDWPGRNLTNQYPLPIALPFLDAYAAYYLRFVIKAPRGLAADSTSYKLVYMADSSPNKYELNSNYFKHVSHYDFFLSNSVLRLVGGIASGSARIDTRVETTPGNFQLPDRAVLFVIADTKTDDDSVFVVVQGLTMFGPTNNLDSLYFGVLTAGNAIALELSLRSNFTDALAFIFQTEAGDAADTNDIWLQLDLEVNP